MFRSWKLLSGIVSVWLCGSSVFCLPGVARDVPLVLAPQKIPAEADKWSLLPPESSLMDGDAVPLYEKAARALPDKALDSQIQGWLKTPVDQLPVEQVEQALESYLESLKCVAQAVRRRECSWPQWKPGMQVANVDEYRRLIFAVRLWARLEMARNEYEGAVVALRTGFGMARQHGQAPTLLQVQMAVAMAHVTCREVEELVQRRDAPNLYLTLATLPRPFVDVEKAITYEGNVATSGLMGRLLRNQHKTVLDPAHDRTRVLAKRLDSNLAALQCVEAIRSYAASHGGELPGTLADITEVPVPKDPMNDRPFQYSRTGAAATLASFLPAGGDERERIRYQIRVGN